MRGLVPRGSKVCVSLRGRPLVGRGERLAPVLQFHGEVDAQRVELDRQHVQPERAVVVIQQAGGVMGGAQRLVVEAVEHRRYSFHAPAQHGRALAFRRAA